MRHDRVGGAQVDADEGGHGGLKNPQLLGGRFREAESGPAGRWLSHRRWLPRIPRGGDRHLFQDNDTRVASGVSRSAESRQVSNHGFDGDHLIEEQSDIVNLRDSLIIEDKVGLRSFSAAYWQWEAATRELVRTTTELLAPRSMPTKVDISGCPLPATGPPCRGQVMSRLLSEPAAHQFSFASST